MSWARRTLIVPAAHVALARSLCGGMAEGDAGKNMLTTPLSATGTGAATHYISSGLIEQQFADLMAAGDAAVYAQAQAAGIATTQAAVAAMLTASDITADAPFTAMARLGLKLIQPAV